MTRVAVLVPSRERPHKVAQLAAQFFATADPGVPTDLVVVLDADDAAAYPRLEGVRYVVVPADPEGARGMCRPLNVAARALCGEYAYLGFWGDDHFPRTPGWNRLLRDRAAAVGPFGIVYGDDLLAGEGLPTEVLLDARIVRCLGYMAPPALRHLYIDNFWLALGRALGTLAYVPDVVIEHLHCCVGKSATDAVYQDLNSAAMGARDRAAFEAFEAGGGLRAAVAALRAHPA